MSVYPTALVGTKKPPCAAVSCVDGASPLSVMVVMALARSWRLCDASSCSLVLSVCSLILRSWAEASSSETRLAVASDNGEAFAVAEVRERGVGASLAWYASARFVMDADRPARAVSIRSSRAATSSPAVYSGRAAMDGWDVRCAPVL